VAYPAPRPLYNLNKLTARPHDPVWLFEGPRKADKAEPCYPAAVTTANAGGANAIKQTDFAPLRGRDVILWRDSDEAGAKWEERTIVALRAVAVASIRVVNIAALPLEMTGRIAEAKRGKFDVVDLIETGIASEAIRAAAEAACEPVGMSPGQKVVRRRLAEASQTRRSMPRSSRCQSYPRSPMSASGARPPGASVCAQLFSIGW